ncbi:unnamed protein product, partial [Nesidiocoris tenuis]
MKLHERTCARVVGSRNRSAYGLLSRAGRLVRNSAMLVRAAVISLIEGLGLPGSAPPGSGSGSAARLHGGRVGSRPNVQTELCFPALSCLLRR